MIALLVLLPALVLSAEYEIDWTKCGLETVCYCPNSEGEKLSLQAPPAPLQKNNVATAFDDVAKCSKEGMQNKFLTEEIVLFQLQVIGTHEWGNDETTLILNQNNHEFGCKFYRDKPPELFASENLANEFKISLFEDRSRFDTQIALCAIKVERATKFTAKMTETTPTTYMTLKSSQPKTIEHISHSPYFFQQVHSNAFIHGNPLKCDPYGFKDLAVHGKFYVRSIRNRDNDKLSCENYGPSYKMMYQKAGRKTPIEEEVKQLECKSCPGCTDFEYELEKKDGGKIVLLNPEVYTIFCAAEMAEVCANPNGDECPASDPTCPVYSKGGKEENGDSKAATLTCPGKRWVINKTYLELEADPECRRDKVKEQNTAAFFSAYLGNEKKIWKGDRCFTQYEDCMTKSKLFLPVCNVSSTTCGVDVSNKMKLKCHDPDRQMTVKMRGEELDRNVTELTCDLTSGLWQIDSTTAVLPHSAVNCKKTTVESYVVSKASMSKGNVDAIAYGGAGACCVVIAVIAIIVFCCVTRRHKTNIKKKREWVNLKKNEKIAECKELLPQSLVATPETSHLILEGLIMVDLLLDMESEDMEVWNEAFKFLTRFLGSITRIDHSIWYMFSRYTHLQAKKLIVKHGWLSKNLIRKKKTRGLIRSIAIRLLSYSLYDPNSDETEELLIEGFRKLGFRGVEQYPHCGVLWSVIMHARCEYRKNNNNPKTNLLQDDTFVNTLRDIGCKKKLPEQAVIPKEEQIVGIGSIAQQAAFAYGGSINQNYQTEKMRPSEKRPKPDWLDWSGNEEGGEVPLSFLEGACQTLTHNPCGTVLDVCGMWPNPRPNLLVKMKTVAPEKRWNAIIMDGIRHSVYYGRGMDATRLRDRFLPKHFDHDIGKLKLEQQLFEEAMEKEKEHLRSWLVNEVDKEELKKKPDYTITSNVKLDNRVTAQGTESLNRKDGADPCTPDLSKSDSKSESKSNSTDDPGAASPAPPAATPDVAAAPTPPAAATPAAEAAAPAAPQ